MISYSFLLNLLLVFNQVCLADPAETTQTPISENTQLTETDNPLNGGSFTLQLEGQDDSSKPRIQTIWGKIGTVEDAGAIDQLVEKLAEQGKPPIQILTVESSLSHAQELQKKLKALGIESTITALPDDAELKVARLGHQLLTEHEKTSALVESLPLPVPQLRKKVSDTPTVQERKTWLKEKLRGAGKWWMDRLEIPNRQEVILGLTKGAYRLGIAYTVWFSIGLHPGIAAALVAGQTAATLAVQVGIRSADNIFGNRVKNTSSHHPNGSSHKVNGSMTVKNSAPSHNGEKTPVLKNEKPSFRSSLREFRRRMLFELSLAELWRIISGPVNDAHSALSSLGQGELFANVLAGGTGGSILSTIRNRNLSRRASMWLGFYTFFIASTLQVTDIAGYHIYTLADLGFFQVNLSTVLIFAHSLSAAALIKYKPKLMETIGEASSKFLDRVTHFVSTTGPKAIKKLNPLNCLKLFGRLGGEK